MRLRLWPRTLVVQLICVTAAAVVVSNIGVAIYFERANLAQFNNYLSDRMIDRTTAVATTMREISPQSRAIVMRTMGTGNWKFSQIPGPVPSRAMTDEETTFARRVIDGLPANYPDRENVVIIAHIDPQTVAQAQRPHRNEPGSDAVQVFLPLDGKTTLSALFLRPPPGGLPPDWSEIVGEVAHLPHLPITKRTWSAFHGTELDLQLRRRGIDTIIVGGVATNFGGEQTARDDWHLNYNVVVAEDASTSMGDGLHAFAIEKVLPRVSRVRESDEIIAALKGS